MEWEWWRARVGATLQRAAPRRETTRTKSAPTEDDAALALVTRASLLPDTLLNRIRLCAQGIASIISK